MAEFQKIKNGNILIEPKMYNSYFYIPGEFLTGAAASNRLTLDIDSPCGLYLHRMVVFSFGDRNGKKFVNDGVIDHLDMNHENCKVENLELISYGLNLFRAYYKTAYQNKGKKPDVTPTETLFKNFYNSLDRIDQKILDLEISKEIKDD